MMRFPNSRRRRGFTLRELSVAMTVGSAVMMVAVGSLHRAFDWASIARDRRHDDQTVFRLTQQFREDVHRASDAELTDQTLKLTLPSDTSVVYEAGPEGLVREQTRQDQRVRQEAYRWKQTRRVTLRKLENENQLEMSIHSVLSLKDQPAPLWRFVRASIGLRQQHERGDIGG
ncbi:prepilin-type N-terminal cleavage/methylation domain-containing protein [Roseiconus nitratireducens]|nr:prepilin-type N-terminal cleavage/methylation domain-containing protein [Roseiconus nitratireducens]